MPELTEKLTDDKKLEILTNSAGKLFRMDLEFEISTKGDRKTTVYQKILGYLVDCSEEKTVSGKHGYKIHFNPLLFLSKKYVEVEHYEPVEKPLKKKIVDAEQLIEPRYESMDPLELIEKVKNKTFENMSLVVEDATYHGVLMESIKKIEQIHDKIY